MRCGEMCINIGIDAASALSLDKTHFPKTEKNWFARAQRTHVYEKE